MTEQLKHWDQRIKELMEQVGYPNSMSLYQAFKQFQNELTTSQPAQAGEVDAALTELFRAAVDWGRTYGRSYSLDHLAVDDACEHWAAQASAILALRPQAVPTDEQIVDWLCEEAQHTCGQWQVVIESDNPSFIDAVKEHAARAHGITAQGAQGGEG